MSNLKHYSWSAIDKFGGQAISLVGNILIARLLTPNDYGLIAMLSIFMGIAWNFTESGFADWLIRDKDATKKDFSIIFVHNIIFALFFYLVLFLSAPHIAKFYQQEELINITRVVGLGLILRALTVTEFTRMRKELEFKKTAIINLLSAFLALILAYAMALAGFGYWTLVYQVIFMGVLQVFLIIVLNKWRPSFYFNWKSYKKMRSFGNNMLASYFTNQIGSNLYSLFIGKFYSVASLGFYNQGEKLNKVSFQGLNGMIMTTSYSLLAREENPVKRRKMYKGILSQFFFIHFIVSLFVIGIAEDLILVIFGNQWVPTAPYLQLILISFLLRPFLPLNSNIIKIANKPQLYRNLTFVKNGLVLVALLVTFKISIESILYGQIVANFLIAIIFMFYCGKFINLYPKEQVGLALKQLSAPLAATLLAVYLSGWINLTTGWNNLLIFTLIYFFTFVLVNILTRNKTFFMIYHKIKSKIA